jgi:hypothetical protein
VGGVELVGGEGEAAGLVGALCHGD